MSLPQRKIDRPPSLLPFRETDLLGREGEIALGKRLEAAEERMLAAALEHPAGVRRLQHLSEALERGDVRLHNISRDYAGKGFDEAEQTLAMLERIRTAIRRARDVMRLRRRDDEKATERAEQRLLEAIRAMRFARATVHRLADEFFDELDSLGDDGGVAAIAYRMKRARREYLRARDELVEANLRLVVSLAKRWRDAGLPFADLVQEGTLGLMRGADHFDWQLGNRFSTYASWWIRQSIQRAIIEQASTIRMPYHLAEVAQKSRRVSAAITAKLGRAPTNEEIAEAIGVTVEKIESLRSAERMSTRSLSAPLSDEGDTELGDLIPANDAPDPEEAAVLQGDARLADRAIAVLEPREQHIIRLRFGLGDDRDHTLEEVGNELSVTRERVRQLERRAILKMRRHLEGLRE
jgi:RNA polymerase primary sigma factor